MQQRRKHTAAMLLALLAIVPVPTARAGERGLVNTTKSPNAQMYMVDLGDVRWNDGLWGDRFQVCRDGMVPHMWELLRDPNRSHIWANFEIAAGVGQGRDGKYHGPPFDDGDFFKWFEALAQVYAVTRDPKLDALMDQIIAVVAKAQREDGYLSNKTVIGQRQGGEKVQALQDRLQFETYNMGHLMTAACVHYRATGKTSMLDLARKACDYLYRYYKQSSPELARNAICPSHYMGVVEMYRTTGDPRYLELARQLIEIRDLVKDGTDDNQDRVPFREMTEAIGHAVRANYLYAGVADVYAETGDPTLLATLETLWRNVTEQKLYVTGATGALYDGVSPDGGKNHNAIQRVQQAYGRDFQLPNVTAYNESCAIVGNALWNWRMLAATGQARFADVLELALYNGVPAAISLDGTKYFYVNPLRKVRDLPFYLRWSRTRQPYYSSFCCPPNVVRTIAEVSNYVYGLSKDTLWVHLYGANTLDTAWTDGARIKLRQETDYPWDGKVRIVIAQAPDRPITIKLRIPGWADAAGVKVNGKPAAGTPKPGTYFDVRRTWKAGDAIELDLPMPVKLIEANPLVEEDLNQVAVKRGPIVYCLESIDLPKGARLEDVVLPLNAKFALKREKIANADLVALTGKALDLRRKPWTNQELYREVGGDKPRKIDVTLIPYYAWDNRGDDEMSVWLPVR